VRVQRVWLELTAAANPVRRPLARTAIDLGGVRAERIDGGARQDPPAILYLHGGGYTLGSPRFYRPLATSLARAADAVVFAADYRRAPEHPCPAALDDAIAGYRGLLDLGFDPARIALAGDSAGGGLCVATALEVGAAALPAPAALALISPWSDLTLSGESIGAKARDDVIRRSWLEASGRSYRNGIAAEDPRCSPLYADLAGLPPTLIQVGTDEILLSDAERFAERVRAAGVDVSLDRYEGLFHVFQNLPGRLPQAEAAIAEIGAFVRRHWTAT
jgi:epsilon-lactone hydrolase